MNRKWRNNKNNVDFFLMGMFVALSSLILGSIISVAGIFSFYLIYKWRFKYLYYYSTGIFIIGLATTLMAAVIEDYHIWYLNLDAAKEHLVFGGIYNSLGMLLLIIATFKVGRDNPNYVDILYSIGIGILFGLPFAADIFAFEMDTPNIISLKVNNWLEILLMIYIIIIIPNGYLLYKNISELRKINFNENYEKVKDYFFVLIGLIFIFTPFGPLPIITGNLWIRYISVLLINFTALVLIYLIIKYPLIFAFISKDQEKYLEIMVLAATYPITDQMMKTIEEATEFDSQIRGTAFALINSFISSSEKTQGQKKGFLEHTYTYGGKNIVIIQKEKISLVVISTFFSSQLIRVYKELLERIIRVIKMYDESVFYGEIDYKMVRIINHLIRVYIPIKLSETEITEAISV